jgi:putative tricarboxylic transport membrane protein
MTHPDRISGSFLAVIAGIAMFEASRLPFGSIRAPDAGFFPLSLSILMMLFACGIILNSFFNKPDRLQFSSRSWQVAAAACAFVLYALSLSKAGFVLGTTAILLLLMRGFGGISWTRSLIIAIPIVLLTYFAFVQLGVPLPPGPLPF